MLRRLTPFLPAVLWAAIVWVIGGLDSTPRVSTDLPLDKVAHFTMYGILGWLIGRAWFAEPHRSPWILPLLLPLMLGAADELRQRSIGTRSADVADWVADAAGAAAGMLVALRTRRAHPLPMTRHGDE